MCPKISKIGAQSDKETVLACPFLKMVDSFWYVY